MSFRAKTRPAVLGILLVVFGAMARQADGAGNRETIQPRATQPATSPRADVNARPGPPPGVPPGSTSPAFTRVEFSRDYEAGTKDANGRLMDGTETMRLLGHQGRLFAGTDGWMDIPYGARPASQPARTGPQVLVKDSASAPWRVDVSFPQAIRMEAIVSATMVTDAAGRKLVPPVNILVASPSAPNTAAWTRDEATGKWARSMVAEGVRGGLRSFGTHVDKVTGIQYLFAGASAVAPGSSFGSIFRAAYDPAAPGKLRWDKEPELSGTGRVMALAEADGVLYAACGIKSEDPNSGGLFRRQDGQTARWELLWRWPHRLRDRGDETTILRGLTAIPDPGGGRHQVLLGTCDYPGVVYRIDPGRDGAVTTELDIRAYFAKAFGVAELRGPCLSAYNNFLPATDPDSGDEVLLLGVWINHPDGKQSDNGASAWYLVRHADGTYGHGRVFDPQHARPNPPRGLLATRTIEVSPFPEDKGRVLYFGGFDCADIESHNTAWIYRGTLKRKD